MFLRAPQTGRLALAARALVQSQTKTVSQVSRVAFFRQYATEKGSENDKKATEKASGSPQSLLNDDLLERAGMDLGERKAAAEEGEEAESGDEKKWAGTARKPRDESSTMEKRGKRGYFFTVTAALGLVGFALYSARPFDAAEAESNPDINAESYDPASLWKRAKARSSGNVNYFVNPSFEKLLPDPLPAPYGRPLTLVLALDDLLVKSEWSREHGWRTAKRPGVDYFLVYLAQYYEIVLFSDKYQVFDEETIVKLDPYRAAISYSLFREASRFKNGKIVKDLSHLNRDLSKVVCVDVSPDAVALQPENAIVLPRWNGKADDTDLIRMIPLLEWIGAQPVKDVRPILSVFKNDERPVLDEFEHRERLAREKWQKTAGNRSQGGWASALLGVSKRQDPNMMPQDYIRQEGQRGYAQFRKLIDEQGQKMLEEEKRREQEIMERHKMTINQYMTQGGPSQEDLQRTMAEMEAQAQAEQTPAATQ